jgi:hypothetical protein
LPGGGGGCCGERGSGMDMAEVTSTMEARAHGALTASAQAAARFSTHRARNRAWTMANWFSQKSSQMRARFFAPQKL